MMLRLVAVAIALAGLADPTLTVSQPVRPPLAITILDTPSLVLPHDDGTGRQRAYRSAETLASRLRGHYDITIREQAFGVTADPCPVDSACIVISDGARPRVFDARDRVLGAVRLLSRLTPNVAITRLDSPAETDASALAALDVHLAARGASGHTTTIEVFDDDVPVGSASHTWEPDSAYDTSSTTVRVEWTPLATGVRDLRVVASGIPDEETALDNEARTAVEVVRGTVNVLVYEPQPSWTTTFVRRALEADARFRVFTRTRVGPAQIASSTSVTLSAEALVRERVAVAVVASPQSLERDELEALDRFARRRGSSVVLLLDAPPTGELASFLSLRADERRETAPVAIGPLKASEFLVLRPQGWTASVVASRETDPVIVSRSFGHGRIVTSGALDAWRYRAEGNRFDSFWRSLVAATAAAAGEPLVLKLSPSLAAKGQQVAVELEWRAIDEPQESLEAEATVRCGSRTTLVRLRPSGSRARFRGGFDAPVVGTCEVLATIRPLGSATAALRVTDEPAGPLPAGDTLSAAVAAFGGVTVDGGDEATLVTRLQAFVSPQRTSAPVHPMRSPWWIVPFATALGGEWWLRRRKGLL